MSLPNIGKVFNRDHSTVLHSLEQCDNKIKTDPAFAFTVKTIRINIVSKK